MSASPGLENIESKKDKEEYEGLENIESKNDKEEYELNMSDYEYTSSDSLTNLEDTANSLYDESSQKSETDKEKGPRRSDLNYNLIRNIIQLLNDPDRIRNETLIISCIEEELDQLETMDEQLADNKEQIHQLGERVEGTETHIEDIESKMQDANTKVESIWEILNNSNEIENETKIPAFVDERYVSQEKFDPFKKQVNSLVSFHKTSVETRLQRERLESVITILIGLGILLWGTKWIAGSGIATGLLLIGFVTAMALSGLSLVVAGLIGIRNARKQ